MTEAKTRTESSYRPVAKGAPGAIGLMQVMPPTARLLGPNGALEDLAEPEANIPLGVLHLAEDCRWPRATSARQRSHAAPATSGPPFWMLSVRSCDRVRACLATIG
jgi:soluble lytic murein transglycosylase-like protein